MDVMMMQSFQLMLYGLVGVFSALGILFLVTSVMGKLFPADDKAEEKG